MFDSSHWPCVGSGPSCWKKREAHGGGEIPFDLTTRRGPRGADEDQRQINTRLLLVELLLLAVPFHVAWVRP